MAVSFDGSGRALRDRRPSVLERWLANHARSRLRIPRPMDPRELMGTAETIAEALGAALGEPECQPGGGALREAEKRFVFAGGSLGMSGAGAFDVAAFVLALRDTLYDDAVSDAERVGLASLFDWFCALAVEGYTKSREDAVRMRHRDELERGTPVVMVAAELPAALLLGDPDRSVLEGTFGRLLLAVVRVGARAVIIDAGGLSRPRDPSVLDALRGFAGHRKVIGSVQVVISGLASEAEADWKEAIAPATVVVVERFEDAVARGLEAGGHKIRQA